MTAVIDKYAKFIIIVIFIVSIVLRLAVFSQEGGDHVVYKQAVIEFLAGVNPYAYTVKSFSEPELELEHGYAYLPTLLYIQSGLTALNDWLDVDQPTIYWYKLPVLLADIGVGYLLYKILKKENFSNIVIIGGLLFWFFNPYFFMNYQYTNYETLPLFFLLLSYITLGKRNFTTGLLFGLAITLKTFPIILFALFILKSTNRKRFILGALLAGIIIALPFMRSYYDFNLMIQGSLLVHGERGIQGRPFLSLATVYLQNYGLNPFQAEYSRLFSVAALISTQLVTLFLYFKKKITNVWILTLVSFAVYLLLTPVLNRTHLIWALPFIYLGVLQIFRNKLQYHFLTIFIVYVLMCAYYYFWVNGINNPDFPGGAISIDASDDNAGSRFSLISEWFIKMVKAKKQLVGE